MENLPLFVLFLGTKIGENMLYYTKIRSLEKMARKLVNTRKSEVMRVYGK